MRGRNDHSLGREIAVWLRPGFFSLLPLFTRLRIAFLFKALRNEKEIESYHALTRKLRCTLRKASWQQPKDLFLF